MNHSRISDNEGFRQNRRIERALGDQKGKNMKRLATVIVAAMATANLALAAVERSQDAPTVDIVASNPNGSIQTRAFDISESSNHARGQLFKLDKDKGWIINAITFKKSGGQTFNNASITLYIFEGTEAQWTTGHGH
ncbi:hypothetical protein, partial [Pontiella sp.]|uniref:hypothetical protein n=1 Tax=Pontiella sp. TaxID=2837462 RepID=UPI00356A93E4